MSRVCGGRKWSATLCSDMFLHPAHTIMMYSRGSPTPSMSYVQYTCAACYHISFLAACPCTLRGGYCDDYGGCICYQGYTGQYCEVLACPCNPSGGYCDGYGGCYCYPGYTGQYCDEMLGRKKACRQEGRTHSLVHGACLILGSAV